MDVIGFRFFRLRQYVRRFGGDHNWSLRRISERAEETPGAVRRRFGSRDIHIVVADHYIRETYYYRLNYVLYHFVGDNQCWNLSR